MKLLPLDSPARTALAADWLAREENYQWLDFGNGRPMATPALLRVMAQRDSHLLRLYTGERDDTPIGIVALSNIDRVFGSAYFWGASGDKSFRSRGYSTHASAQLLTLGFRDLGLHSIQTWVVEGNPSQRTVERLHFRYVGRQRQCHLIDGRLCDRLLFDLLAEEHRVLEPRSRREPAHA
jgi:RimJ/RimL family protein N-acetyltransferase